VDEVTRRVALVALVLALLLPQRTALAATTDIEIEAELAGRDITSADSTDPIRIEPREEVPLTLTIRNTGDQVERIRYVRLEGKALGLTFLTYDLGIRTTLQPGEQTTLETALDFFDLERQATGYLGTSLSVYDGDRRLLASQGFVVDVRGNATSTLGLFAVVVVAVAAFSVFVLVLNTLRRRLPANRFVRGVQFAIAGSSIGVTLSLGVSVLRVAFADVEAWVPLVFLPTVIGFALGYIAPGPLSRSIRDVQEEEALQAAAEKAVARATGAFEAAASGAFIPGSGFAARSRTDHGSGRHAATAHESGEHVVVDLDAAAARQPAAAERGADPT
jgi:hypothetical protein